MKERMQMLNARVDLSLRCQCDLVGVSRSSFYYQPLGESEQNLEIMRLMAISRHGKPEIINSNQGSQFTCHLWTDFVESNDIKISMDGKGRAIDNQIPSKLYYKNAA